MTVLPIFLLRSFFWFYFLVFSFFYLFIFYFVPRICGCYKRICCAVTQNVIFFPFFFSSSMNVPFELVKFSGKIGILFQTKRCRAVHLTCSIRLQNLFSVTVSYFYLEMEVEIDSTIDGLFLSCSNCNSIELINYSVNKPRRAKMICCVRSFVAIITFYSIFVFSTQFNYKV